MAHHYAGYGLVLHTGTRLVDVEYGFDYDPESGINGFAWSIDGYLPPKPTTLDLLLEGNDQFVPAYWSFSRLDPDRQLFQYRLSLSDDQPDDPKNLVAQR